MNKEEILNMPAGREMDALVLASVFGVMVFRDECGEPYRIGFFQEKEPVWNYSGNISSAWAVWNKLVERERYPTLHEGVNDNGEPCVWMSLVNPVMDCRGEDDVPLAICRAALLAVITLD